MKAAGAATGEFSDVLAVTHQCRRALRSPTPAVALVPGPGDPPACARASGLAQDWPARSSARLMPSTDPAQLAHSLRDRPDGVQMLADALAEDSAVARARKLFRLFERAFAKRPQQLRPLAVHGDRRPAHARSADAASYIARLEWAAYDVLLHRSAWRGPLPDRRPLLTLAAVPAQDGSGTILLARGAAVAIDHLDAYGDQSAGRHEISRLGSQPPLSAAAADSSMYRVIWPYPVLGRHADLCTTSTRSGSAPPRSRAAKTSASCFVNVPVT